MPHTTTDSKGRTRFYGDRKKEMPGKESVMNYTEWKLTDEEKAKCEQVGCSVVELQEAKKRAYIANGGIILNPDALEDMYKALKEAIIAMGSLYRLQDYSSEEVANSLATFKQVLAKAEEV